MTVVLIGTVACGSGNQPLIQVQNSNDRPVFDPEPVVYAQTCAEASPDDNIADDVALQDCLNQYPVLNLRSGEPGYILARGLEILGYEGVTLRGETGIPAHLIAHATLDNYMIKAFGVRSFILENLIIDGNRDQRTFLCNTNGMRPGNLYIIGDAIRIEHVESARSLCGSGMGVAGSDMLIANNWVHDNGFTDEVKNRGTEQWSDGITITDCRSSTITDNLVENNTDVGIVIAGSRDCKIYGNRINQYTRKAFAGLAVHNFGSNEDQGDHIGSIFQNNIIKANPNMLDYGISLGIHSWFAHLQTRNATVINNHVSGAIINLSLDGLSDSDIMDNVIGLAQPGELLIAPCSGTSAEMAFAHIDRVCLQAHPRAIGLITDQGLGSCQYAGDACTVLEQLPDNCSSRADWERLCAGRRRGPQPNM